MIENIAEIESSLGLEEGTFQAAIDSDESKKIELPVGKFYDTEKYEIFTKEDYATRTENLKNENKNAGVEIAVKGARTELGLEFEGKTMENLLSAHKAQVLKDAQVEPDSKISELESDKSKLQGLNLELTKKYEDLVAEGLKKDGQRTIDGEILSKLGENLTIPKDDVMYLFKKRYDVSMDDGKTIIKQGGEVMKDQTTLEPLGLSDVVSSFTEQYTKKVEGGAGGDDTALHGSSGSLESFNKEMAVLAGTDPKYNPGGELYNQEMNTRITNGSLKV